MFHPQTFPPLVSAQSSCWINLDLHIATLPLKFVCAVHQDCSISTSKFMKTYHFQTCYAMNFKACSKFTLPSNLDIHSFTHCSSSSQQSGTRFKPEAPPNHSQSPELVEEFEAKRDLGSEAEESVDCPNFWIAGTLKGVKQ